MLDPRDPAAPEIDVEIVARGSIDRGRPQLLLVTTSRSLLLLDPTRACAERIDAGRGLYYGIEQTATAIYVAARRRMVSSDIPIDSERGAILRFDRALESAHVIEADFPLRDLHQIRRVGTRLFVTCSHDNLIAILDGGTWSKWFPLGEPDTPPLDRNHFNTIELIDGHLCVVAHNFGDSELLFFDPDTLRLRSRIPLGRHAHNVWRSDGEWMTCSSSEGRLVGSAGTSLEVGGFPRGICWTGTRWFIGLSEVAERTERDFTDAGIAEVDAVGQVSRVLHLPAEGLVLEVDEYIGPIQDEPPARWTSGTPRIGGHATPAPSLAQSRTAGARAAADRTVAEGSHPPHPAAGRSRREHRSVST